MKLAGIIAVFLLVLASCQKEQICPNAQDNTSEVRATPEEDNSGTVSGTTPPTSGIVDPNGDPDAGYNGKKGK